MEGEEGSHKSVKDPHKAFLKCGPHGQGGKKRDALTVGGAELICSNYRIGCFSMFFIIKCTVFINEF